MKYLNKRVLAAYAIGIIVLTVIDFFVNVAVGPIGFEQLFSFIAYNTVLVTLVLAAYVVMKYLQDRGKASK